MKKILACLLCTAMASMTVTPVIAEQNEVKNIIYMIPDGGGMDPFYLSDALKQIGGWNRGIYPNSTITETGEMYAKQYLAGGITTHSANADVTDSAAAGTALSSGYKTKNGYVGVDPDKIPHANILEAAQYAGLNVGMVSTYEWTNATPASFSAHDKDRGNYTPMSEQIVNQGIDVVLGGGFGAAKWGDISEAEKRGYDIMNTREDLQSVQPGDKIWGNLVSGSFPYDIDYSAETPNIAEMTKAAITALNEENGFFLMVEGSKVDGGGHSNFAQGMVGEFLAFDEACKVALNFAEERDDTVVIIVPDHDTGGMNLPADMSKAATELQNGKEPSELTWETTGHTARHGGMFMYVPEGVSYPAGISGKDIGTHKAYEENVVDNTVIAPYIADFLDVDLGELSKELFVDVTDMGEYDSEVGIFRFKDYPVSVKANVSYAFVKDEVADLDGQVTLYINGRFYVPQLLLDIAQGKASFVPSDIAYPIGAAIDTYMPDTTDISKWNGRIKIENYLCDGAVSGKIKFRAPEEFVKLDEIKIDSIAGGETGTAEFECPEFDVNTPGLAFEYDFISDNGKTYSFVSKFKGLAYAGYADETIKVDGIIDDEVWKNGIVMTCEDASRIVMIEDWKGDRDLSADFSMLWDEEYFYLYAVVTDEIFCQNETPDGLWKGDSVQFGLFNDKNGDMVNGTAGTVYEEIGIALIENKPVAYRFISQTGETEVGEIPVGEGFEMACVRDGDDLTYELKCKWSELFGNDYKPELGSVLGFSAVINDNDGGGRRGWMEYGSGIGMYKDVNEFVLMPMLDFSEMNSDEIKIYFNGSNLESDVQPMIIEDRTFVPLRVIFEALGAEVDWDGETGTVISKLGDSTVTLTIGENQIVVDGEARALDVPAQIVNDRTLAPVRAVSEAYGCDVQWNEAKRTVTITK